MDYSRPGPAVTPLEIVLLVTVLLTAALFVPGYIVPWNKAHLKLNRDVSNARQIHIAASESAADTAAANSNTDIGWPADLLPHPQNSAEYITSLVRPGYLKYENLDVFGGGDFSYDGRGDFEPQKHCGFKIFNIRDIDPDTTVFLTTRNVVLDFSPNTTMADAADADAFGSYYVVMRKGGNGEYMKPGQSFYGTRTSEAQRILPNRGRVTR